jgi:hypothetical protein
MVDADCYFMSDVIDLEWRGAGKNTARALA